MARSSRVVPPTIDLVTLMVRSCTQRVAVAVSNKLTLMINEATPVNKRIMRLRICHSLGVISMVSIYAPTEVSDLTVKEVVSAALESGWSVPWARYSSSLGGFQ